MNLINIVKFSILITLASCSNYCELQKRVCGYQNHIACETQQFVRERPFVMKKVTEKLKQIILHEMNEFRNDMAMGKFENLGYKKASNMRLMRWNNEFAYLAKLTIQKSGWGIPTCVATNDFQYPVLKRYSEIGTFEDDVFVRNEIRRYMAKMDKQDFYYANNYEIGCAFGSIAEKGITINNISCILNQYIPQSTPMYELYDVGDTCSNCGMWNEDCSEEKYTGLCAPIIIKHEKELIPPIVKNEPKKDDFYNLDFQFSLSFWILYCLLAVLVLLSFMLSLEVIRSGYKRFYPYLNRQDFDI